MMKMSALTNPDWLVSATFGVAWDKTLPSKQTLFPVWGEKEERRPRHGFPPNENQPYTLRATKGVNMHPFPTITITKSDGTPYQADEEVKLTLVNCADKLPPGQGSCNCDGIPKLEESKAFQLERRGNEVFTRVRGGLCEFKKLQIGCCTGGRGHGSPLCIKAEFVKEGSPLKGSVCYSVPIDVGAKGPFAKAMTGKRTRAEETAANAMLMVPNQAPANCAVAATPQVQEMKMIKSSSAGTLAASYEGAAEVMGLLSTLNLHQYIQTFLSNEIDLQAFLQLSDEDLTQMGITKMGPKVKILKHIAKMREETAYPPGPTTPGDVFSLPDVSTPNFERVPNFSVPDDSPLDSSKRRRLVDILTSNSPPPSVLADRVAMPPPSADFSYNQLSLSLYLSHVSTGKNKLKKVLLFVRSKKDRQATEEIVHQIQQQALAKVNAGGKRVLHEGRPQMMLTLQPDKHGDWVARSQLSGQLWSFKKGDYIKIDNHHDINVVITVAHYFISENGDFVEDTKATKKYPVLVPGSCLEIGVDDNKDMGRISISSNLESDPAETFAVTHNGKLVVSYNNFANQSCIFSFKRRKVDMKKVESLDDFQKELFLSKCLEVDSLDNN